MSSTPATVSHCLLDTRVLAAVIGVPLTVVAAYHGWQSDLAMYATGLELLSLAQWVEREAKWVIQRMKDSTNSVF